MSTDPDALDLPVELDLDPVHEHDEPHHPHGDDHDPVHDEVEARVDPAVAEAVHSVRDRFGASGLRDLLALAGYELDLAEKALATLRAEVDAPPTPEDAAFGSLLASDETGPDDDGGAGSR